MTEVTKNEENSCCGKTSDCYGKMSGCCSGNSQRVSLGRIILGIIVLSAVFFGGVKFGLNGTDSGMYMKGHGGAYKGCMMDKCMGSRCGMMQQEETTTNTPPAPSVDNTVNTGEVEVPPTEENTAPTEPVAPTDKTENN